MGRVISMAIVLLVFWLTLSGHYTTFLITSGVISAVAIALLAYRMDVADREGHPIHLGLSALTYWPWLVWQIILSALNVTRIIINPSLPISPTLTRVKMSQKTDVARVTYANSITLTPGTISVDIEGDEILVHAITRDNASDLEAGGMDRRCTQFEGSV
ncbi:MAG: Na+/H+ antiporter subunit E [Rhodospirillaceae bacterium]|jgi:multicomponent Na+:H+ antiporter subunit E|nr:Na+/H+ antiporter subunit E [Rhodospirillaceae bacterium]MBT5566604.1 Na+/H+ antiporter subunit E [Rhodospirillaceae bacterium]MBT6090693.1 Na+/H+ antiporter subunit E [Rhodospirillaceae bacterium]